MYGIVSFFTCLMCTFSYLHTLLYNLIWVPQRDFVLLNNINFGDTGLNLTEIVPNIQNERVFIIESHFPYMNKINDTYEPIYGGIPQYVNYTDFRETIQNSIDYNNLTTSYNGFIVFDTEKWTPIWETISQIYQNMTINYTLGLYPELKNNDELLKSRSREIWNQKSMDLLLKGIEIARNKCPLSKIGYYGYPVMPYWGNKKDFEIASNHNDELFSLWNNVDVLLPSIYIPYISTNDYTVFLNNYDYVEKFAGISGSEENIPHLPDGIFQPPMEMNCIEHYVKEKLDEKYTDRKIIPSRTANLTAPTEEQLDLGRSACQYRNQCMRGCSFGAYFSSQSATLPAAERTGNLTTVTNAIAERVIYDDSTGKVGGIRIIDANANNKRDYVGKVIFLCASTLGSTHIMLNSISERFPNGIANDSGVLGHYLMDHIFHAGARGRYAGLQENYEKGQRPNAIYIPRFRNVNDDKSEFLRGYGYEGWSSRVPNRNTASESIDYGASFKQHMQGVGEWEFEIMGFGEMLPQFENHVRLDKSRTDQWGIPLLHTSCDHGNNELMMLEDIKNSAVEMLEFAGLHGVEGYIRPKPPGLCIHEMGTARMGDNPKYSILNRFNQCHSVDNLFVTDGAAMTSTACQNPSLTYMALTARAVDYAVNQLKEGQL